MFELHIAVFIQCYICILVLILYSSVHFSVVVFSLAFAYHGGLYIVVCVLCLVFVFYALCIVFRALCSVLLFIINSC